MSNDWRQNYENFNKYYQTKYVDPDSGFPNVYGGIPPDQFFKPFEFTVDEEVKIYAKNASKKQGLAKPQSKPKSEERKDPFKVWSNMNSELIESILESRNSGDYALYIFAQRIDAKKTLTPIQLSYAQKLLGKVPANNVADIIKQANSFEGGTSKNAKGQFIGNGDAPTGEMHFVGGYIVGVEWVENENHPEWGKQPKMSVKVNLGNKRYYIAYATIPAHLVKEGKVKEDLTWMVGRYVSFKATKIWPSRDDSSIGIVSRPKQAKLLKRP